MTPDAEARARNRYIEPHEGAVDPDPDLVALFAELDRLREELAQRAPDISPAEAAELSDILRTLTPSGVALCTSARELVRQWELQRAEATRPAPTVSRAARRAFVRALPERLVQIPASEWPEPAEVRGESPVEAWRSRRWVVLVYAHRAGAQRVSIRRASGREPITWDELMAIKRDIGRGDRWALEAYPPDEQVVDVAAMRHLWLVVDAPNWAWIRGGG